VREQLLVFPTRIVDGEQVATGPELLPPQAFKHEDPPDVPFRAHTEATQLKKVLPELVTVIVSCAEVPSGKVPTATSVPFVAGA
jgi:hypothetical protein